jgi:hypothetical protein
MRSSILLVSLCVACCVFSGCPQPGGGNENVNDNENPSNLTDAQKQAIEKGMTEIESLVEVFSTLNAFADPRLALNTLGPLDIFGQCPIVSYLKGATGVNTLITLDFGGGCSSLVTGNQAVSGLSAASVNLTTHVATIDFTTLVFAGKTVQGQLTPVTISDSAGEANLAGNMTVNVAGTGQFVGNFDVTLTNTGRITINSAVFTAENGPPSQITLTAVIVDPTLTLNLVPFQGSAQFDTPSAAGTGVEQAVITFTTETAQNGTVQVQVTGSPSTEFQVPGLVSS